MAVSQRDAAGRPRDLRVTEALQEATLSELSECGFEKCTIAAVASRARTSKQAIYRRFQDKEALVAASIEHGLRSVSTPPPQRTSVADDLNQCLSSTVLHFRETALGGAMRAVVPFREKPPIANVFENAENDLRLVLRQVFIATPFEADMEMRIDLLMGLIYFRALIKDAEISQQDLQRAIYLVLGLVAPRDPVAGGGLPGL